jgi:alkaline phosphatase D
MSGHSRRQVLHGAGALGIAGALSACSSKTDEDPPAPPIVRKFFLHGVASGDPLPTAVILWTRVTPPAGEKGSIQVKWELASDTGFAKVVASGTVNAELARDHTVKVDATGLTAATTYYYRFTALGESSVVGRTRTAPSGATSRLRFGVCSCASLAHGYFHAYAGLAKRADLDAVIHLGDYIYEYKSGGYGSVREYEPPHEIVTLADYRLRYAQYHRDAQLQEAHRQHPFIAIWDDHEFADNAYSQGAKNHDVEEGDFAKRRAAAEQAYAEWMPIREQQGGKIFRSLAYGDLVELIMLDSRIWGRAKQNPDKNDPALKDPMRTILGDDQEKWLAERLKQSKARFKLVGQQVVMAQLPAFYNEDAWDGYPGSRERFFDVIESSKIADVVVLTGDVHSSFAGELVRDPMSPSYDPKTGAGALAVELVAPAITSPGFPAGLLGAAKTILAQSPYIKYHELTSRGYVVLDVDHKRLQAAWYHYDDIVDPQVATESFSAAWAVATGSHHVVSDASAATPGQAPPPAP